MARQARERCESGVYHVVTRGINRQDTFRDQDDLQPFLGTLGRVKTDKFEVYGYCLMSNHVHLLIHEKSEEIHQIMKRIKMEIRDTCLDDEIKQRKTDGEVKVEIEAMLNKEPVTILRTIEKQKRDEILRRIKVIEGATQRQIARVTGLDENMIFKA